MVQEMIEKSYLEPMRRAGWRIAIHNDYEQNDLFHTFYLFTHLDGRYVKGEAFTDREALEICWVKAGKPMIQEDCLKLESIIKQNLPLGVNFVSIDFFDHDRRMELNIMYKGKRRAFGAKPRYDTDPMTDADKILVANQLVDAVKTWIEPK